MSSMGCRGLGSLTNVRGEVNEAVMGNPQPQPSLDFHRIGFIVKKEDEGMLKDARPHGLDPLPSLPLYQIGLVDTS